MKKIVSILTVLCFGFSIAFAAIPNTECETISRLGSGVQPKVKKTSVRVRNTKVVVTGKVRGTKTRSTMVSHKGKRIGVTNNKGLKTVKFKSSRGVRRTIKVY